MKDTRENLYAQLNQYCSQNILPMHMPGHKRNPIFHMKNPYEIDVTEVPGLDNLHEPEEVLREWMERAAKKYHSDGSWLLVNGSTGGILAGITACCRRGDKIVVARNCHKSVYNAIKLLELRPVYLYPDATNPKTAEVGIPGIIRPGDVKEALESNPDAACVVLTSPTYEGVVSPVREITEQAHVYNIPVIVDEAHGAHFQWHPAFPNTALTEGADIVIESLHKTLPALTQTGILHMRRGIVEEERLRWGLQTYQSSSPSYVLMASADQCLGYLETEGEAAFDQFVSNLTWFYEEMKKLKHLYLLQTEEKELSKLVFVTSHSDLDGASFASCLREKYGIETEMSCGEYCIAMSSVADERETFERLAKALLEIDEEIGGRIDEEIGGSVFWASQSETAGTTAVAYYHFLPPKIHMYSYETAEWEKTWISTGEAVGKVAAKPVFMYPPGIPMVVEGEIFSKEMVEILQVGEMTKQRIHGMIDGMVQILTERKA